nr:bifunctional DNA primase/polymerase [Sulfitobacter sp. R18_1]
MYRPAEPVFGVVADDLVAKGWSVFPQDQERRPGRVNGETIAWSKKHRLPYELPTPEALKSWKIQCPAHNVAVALGQGSGYTFALDIDVLDKVLSDKVTALADEMFGETPFVRVGKAPKIALFYRYHPDDPVSNVSRTFAHTTDDGEVVPSEHAVEILTEGKPITLLGKHHTTGRYFQWLRKSPLEAGPEEAPLVSSERLAAFFEAVDENLQRFYRNPTVTRSVEEIEWDENLQVNIPKLHTAAGGQGWVESADGKITDGREAYMTKLAFAFVKANPTMPKQQIISLICDQFLQDIEPSTKWNPNRVRNDVTNKVDRIHEKISMGEFTFNAPTSTKKSSGSPDPITVTGKFKMPFSKEVLEERGLGFLPSHERRKELPGAIVEKKDPIVLTPKERQKQIDEIGDGLMNALDEFFEDVFMSNCGRTPDENRVHVIKAPTGAGKTSRTIHYIGEKKDEHHARAIAPRMDGRRDLDGSIITKAQGLDLDYEDDFGNLQTGKKPIVFLLPTYANIEEVRIRAEVLNLDATLSDEELKRAASEKGLFPEEEMDSRLGDMKRDAMDAGLDVLVYKGKIAAGCQMAEKVQAAMQAGVGTSSFCKASVQREDGTSETVYCPFYEGCPAITQKEKIQQADLIFTPHPFMQLSIPKDLEHARAVIADERIHHLFLHTAEFPLHHLTLPRKSVRLTKDELREGITELDLFAAREDAVSIASKALQEGECPAQALFEYTEVIDGQEHRVGASLVDYCLRICSNALRKDTTLNPELELEEVIALCSQPTGLHVREERRFWAIIQERIHLLTNKYEIVGNLQKQIDELDRPEDAERRLQLQEQIDAFLKYEDLPRGDRDMRIQFIREHTPTGSVKELVRISWRTEPNWLGIPLLLLDASAAPEIINKIWGGADVKTHDISGPLHMKTIGVVNRTFSNASVVGDPTDTEAKKLVTAKGLNKLRNAISAVSSWFGDSRVVCGSSILLRKTLNTNWKGPENTDWCHFGAMRGLDFAKFHDAAFSIGRMELPIRTIDGLVAALTYDDEEPELPFDVTGTGLTKEGKPLLMPSAEQRLQMRSGEVVCIPTPMHPGRWGRMIQRQYREEELLQFCGRLRPVYREGDAPIWFALSSVIPENLIIDDLVHIDDLVQKDTYFWDAARRTSGVIHPRVLLGTCPELFKDQAHAVSMMKKFGFNHIDGSQNGRQAQGYTAYRIKNGTDEEYAFIKTVLEDHVTRLGESLTKSGIEFDKIEAKNANTNHKSLARKREADKVEEELGDMEMRAELENLTSHRATRRMFAKGVRRVDKIHPAIPSHPVKFSAGRDEVLKSLFVTFSDMEAHETLDTLWNRMAYEKGLSSKNPLVKENDKSYEDMGNHIGDNDTRS